MSANDRAPTTQLRSIKVAQYWLALGYAQQANDILVNALTAARWRSTIAPPMQPGAALNVNGELRAALENMIKVYWQKNADGTEGDGLPVPIVVREARDILARVDRDAAAAIDTSDIPEADETFFRNATLK